MVYGVCGWDTRSKPLFFYSHNSFIFEFDELRVLLRNTTKSSTTPPPPPWWPLHRLPKTRPNTALVRPYWWRWRYALPMLPNVVAQSSVRQGQTILNSLLHPQPAPPPRDLPARGGWVAKKANNQTKKTKQSPHLFIVLAFLDNMYFWVTILTLTSKKKHANPSHFPTILAIYFQCFEPTRPNPYPGLLRRSGPLQGL